MKINQKHLQNMLKKPYRRDKISDVIVYSVRRKLINCYCYRCAFSNNYGECCFNVKIDIEIDFCSTQAGQKYKYQPYDVKKL